MQPGSGGSQLWACSVPAVRACVRLRVRVDARPAERTCSQGSGRDMETGSQQCWYGES